CATARGSNTTRSRAHGQTEKANAVPWFGRTGFDSHWAGRRQSRRRSSTAFNVASRRKCASHVGDPNGSALRHPRKRGRHGERELSDAPLQVPRVRRRIAPGFHEVRRSTRAKPAEGVEKRLAFCTTRRKANRHVYVPHSSFRSSKLWLHRST